MAKIPGTIHPAGPHKDPLPHVQVIPPLKGLSTSKDTPGVTGDNTADGDGVLGEASHAGVGVHGTADAGIGVLGDCNAGRGVVGISSDGGVGVWGTSVNNEGVHAETHSSVTAAIAAFQKNATSDSAALYAKHDGGRTAAFFDGNVVITGDIVLNGADCAEDFDVVDVEFAEPGTIMVMAIDGRLEPCTRAYDKRVMGIISGAANYRPAIVLDKRPDPSGRRPLALIGKAFCKVDASYGAIEIGDLLTTSATPGHAMKVTRPSRAFGAVLGKAMAPLSEGRGLLPVFVTLL